MTTSDHNLSKAFNDLGRELETYLQEGERGLVYTCYGMASTFTSPDTGLSRDFFNSSVLAAVDLARLKIGPEFLAATLLYYPVSAGVFSMPLEQLPLTPLTREVHHTLTRLLEIGKVFDQFLPWHLKNERAVQFLQARVALASGATEPRAQVEHKRINYTLLEALFSGYLHFTAANLKEGGGRLVGKLRDGTDPVTKYLRGQFSPATNDLLCLHLDDAKPPSPELLDALVDELNNQLTNSALYQPERFQHVQLSEETQELLKPKQKARNAEQKAKEEEQKAQQTELIRLNRFLLEAAYPHAIAGNLYFEVIPELPVIKAVERLQLLKKADTLLPDLPVRRMLAQEALDVHAQALENLGMHALKSKLEDCAFEILSPVAYQSIFNDLDERRESREKFIQRAVRTLYKALSGAGIDAEVTGRPKHIYSLHLKQARTGLPIQEINDSLGLRIIVASVQQCYQALNLLHRLWTPVSGIYENNLFCRDWIRMAKVNGYQSIHTTVFHAKERRPVEVQIRTREMHETAEYGVAAHWVYKRGESKGYIKYVELMADRRRRLEGHLSAPRT